MNRSLQRGAIGLLCVSILLASAACAQTTEDQTEASQTPVVETNTDEPATAEDGLAEQPEEIQEAPYRTPLTGMPADQQLVDRPMMVMVENSPAARPQSGLHKADIVYEILAEGDITRFVAVFQSQSADKIGPVRSIRPYFVELGAGLDAVIVHAGWSQDAMNIIAKKKLNHLDQVYGDDEYYWREKTRKMPHNLYTSTELIREGAKDKKFHEDWANPVLKFVKGKDELSNAGQSHGLVTIPYLQGYTAGYEYDEGSGMYLKLIKGGPHTDAETGERIKAANVLIGEAKHRILDNAGRRAVDVFGPEKGYLLQDGKVQEVTWENTNGAIRAYSADGVELPFLPGPTWVHIVPSLSKVEIGVAADGIVD